MTTIADQFNNPGNLKAPGGAIIWAGQTGVDPSTGFAIFATENAGITAADMNLQTYAKRGWLTPYTIAHEWSTTDQTAYTNNLASALGVGPYTTLNLSDPTVRQRVLAAIFKQEGGTQYKSASLWDDIANAVKNGGPIDGTLAIPGTIFSNVFGKMSGIGDAVKSIPGEAGKVFNFDLGGWLTDQANSGAKKYLLPVVLAIGAILLVMFSAWSLVKDTPVGQTVKTGAKAAVV